MRIATHESLPSSNDKGEHSNDDDDDDGDELIMWEKDGIEFINAMRYLIRYSVFRRLWFL